MLKYFPLLLLFFCWSCGGDTASKGADDQVDMPTSNTTTSTKAATERIESPEQMQVIAKHIMDTQKRIFNMEKEQSLSYTIGDNVFNYELYREENGDTLAIVNNGSLGKYRELDRYIIYQNNRPTGMLVDRLQRDATQQMFSQIMTFYNSKGTLQPTAMVRNEQRKADMLAKQFIPKDIAEVHNVYKFVDEFKQGMEHRDNFTLYFDEFLTEEGRSFLRFKAALEPSDTRYYVTAVRLPENFQDDATLARIEKNAALYKDKKVQLKWETIKTKSGQRIPQWVSGTFE
ncbi:MAG: hypothetical protein AB8G22_16860 [Saprospiraceae bacterium]